MSKLRTKKSKPGSVRIIAGAWRRHRIPVPDGLQLRPTPDRVRETLFNWLDPELAGTSCLDLFAGTGVLGFEALSRGASRAVLVEQNPRVAAALDQTNRELNAHAEVVCADAAKYLTRHGIGPFDVVFVDPPYSQPVEPVLEGLLAALKPGGLVYLERARGADWPNFPGARWSRRGTAGGIEFGLAQTAR